MKEDEAGEEDDRVYDDVDVEMQETQMSNESMMLPLFFDFLTSSLSQSFQDEPIYYETRYQNSGCTDYRERLMVGKRETHQGDKRWTMDGEG